MEKSLPVLHELPTEIIIKLVIILIKATNDKEPTKLVLKISMYQKNERTLRQKTVVYVTVNTIALKLFMLPKFLSQFLGPVAKAIISA